MRTGVAFAFEFVPFFFEFSEKFVEGRVVGSVDVMYELPRST